MRCLFAAAACVLLAAPPTSAEPPQTPSKSTPAKSTPGRVTAVTVYPGQALVTREVDLGDIDGLREVVVTGLPARVAPGSLYAEPIGDVEVRSVRFRTRPVAEDTRGEVRQLDAQLRAAADELAAVESKLGLLDGREQYLQKLEDFTTRTAGKELTSGVLNAQTLTQLTKTIFDGRAAIAEERLTLGVEQRTLKERVALLASQRELLTRSSSKTLREALVFVGVGGPGAKLRLTYLVSGATWSPSYNLRASEARDRVLVEYNASVTQQSGEDWSGVAMTLSTASPSLVASAPRLDPLLVRLARPAPQQAAQRPAPAAGGKLQQLARQQRELSRGRQAGEYSQPNAALEDLFEYARTPSRSPPQSAGGADRGTVVGRGMGFGARRGGLSGGGFGASYAGADFSRSIAMVDQRLNFNGAALQLLECVDPGVTAARGRAPSTAEGISVVYRLAGRTSLPSRSDTQLIPIARLPLEGEFYRVAKPVLTEYVYEEAAVSNDTEVVLLAGPAATFLGDRFVGRSAVPTVAIGEELTIGLGADESLRATRELLKKDRRVQGGNLVSTLDYRLRVENYGGRAATVRVYDRLPKAGGDQVKVSLTTDDGAENVASPREAKQGIVRWDLTVGAKGESAGEQSLGYTLTLEHDRNRTLQDAAGGR